MCQENISLYTVYSSQREKHKKISYLIICTLVFVTILSSLSSTALKAASTPSTPTVVKDIRPVVNEATEGSFPEHLTTVGSTLYFTANDGLMGTELWKSDGTDEGTLLVKDISPGTASSYLSNLTNINNTLFFATGSITSSYELWKSDGTEGGTIRLKAFPPGNQFNELQNLTDVNGTLFFTVNDGVHGTELWKSDGTPSGTVLAADMTPGAGSTYPTNLVHINSTLFFTNDGIEATEVYTLWKSDGTESGTIPIQTFPREPDHVTTVNETLFFEVDNNADDIEELWKSDGTPAGTVPLIGLDPNDPSRFMGDFIDVNGTLFFTRDTPWETSSKNILWKSDGTTTGTVPISDSLYLQSSKSTEFVVVDNTLFFTRFQFNSGNGIWKTDGTSEGTTLVAGQLSDHLTNVNGTLFFAANGQIWKSNGTPEGTTVVKDLRQGGCASVVHAYTYGPCGPNFANLTNHTGTLFFTNNGPQGQELWKSDGTDAGTGIVKDINAIALESAMDRPVDVNGTLFMSVEDGIHGHELWKSDGTDAGTMLVKDIYPGIGGSAPDHLTNVNGTLFFTADDPINGRQLWKSDGTEQGTALVKMFDSHSRVNWLYGGGLVNLNGTLFFMTWAYSFGGYGSFELWKSDGTPSGTVLVARNPNAYLPLYPGEMYVVGNTLFFTVGANTPGRVTELWRSDGTSEGTVLVANTGARNLTDVNGTLFFVDGNTPDGRLWKIDSATKEAVLVRTWIGKITHLTNVHGELFFTTDDGVHGQELWKSDGTEAGTLLVADIVPGAGSSLPANLANVNGSLFFTSDNGVHGRELWRSNGTEVGTVLVKDIALGSTDAHPQQIIDVNGAAIFVADDGETGYELWRSEGTGATTQRIADLNPGKDSSFPSNILLTGNNLFFRATDGTTGFELWSLDLPLRLLPTIAVQPSSQFVTYGQRATLTIQTEGTQLSYQWYQGESGDTQMPIVEGITSTLTTIPLTATTRYWVRVANDVGSIDSDTVTVTVQLQSPPTRIFLPSIQAP